MLESLHTAMMLLTEESDKLLQEMRDSGELCCIDISSDFNYVWDVSFARFDSGNSHIHEKPFGSFEDLNKAVKAAYDLWKGVYTGDISKWKKKVETEIIEAPEWWKATNEDLSSTI